MHDDEDKPASAADDDALIREVKRRLEWAAREDSHNREEALRDLRYLAGEQWDDKQKAARTADNRPSLTINKLPTFLAQVTNEQRQNKSSIKVHPVDDDADPETARIMQGMVRNIEYTSNGDTAYDVATNYAAAAGIGFWRWVTEYEEETSFDQVIRFQSIDNPLGVYMGPHREPDASDMKWAVLPKDVPRDEFTAMWPRADASSLDGPRATGDGSPGWVTETTVRVCEYYRVECDDATLVKLSDGTVAWKDKLPEGLPVEIVRERRSERRRVMLYTVNAVEVLERAEIPCRWIPLFKVEGSRLNIDGRVHRWGLIRHARDPQYMYNLWMSAATEEVALRPKIPYIGAEGQFEGHEGSWKSANTRNYAYLQYKPVTVDGILVPPPQRQPMADVPVGTLQLAMHANDNIKATTGIFDASLGARSNETSGVAIRQRQREGDTSNFHFVDNLARSIRHCGRTLIDAIPRVYDSERAVRILGEGDQAEHVRINQALPIPRQDENGRIREVLNDMTVGRYDLTVSMGPSYSTLRQEAADAMIQFGQAWPRLMEIAGDKVVKAMDWPGADEIAERIERTIPPELRGEEGEGPPAEQLQVALQQLQAYAQQLEQTLQQHEAGIVKEQISAQAKVEVAQINAEAQRDVAELKGAVEMLTQQLSAALAPPEPEPGTMPDEPDPDAEQPSVAEQPAADPMAAFGPLIDAITQQSQAIDRVIRKLNAKKRLQLDDEGNPVGVEYIEEPEAVEPPAP